MTLRRRPNYTAVVSGAPDGADAAAAAERKNEPLVPARQREYPLSCCARAAIACVLLISLAALVASLITVYYSHETFVEVSAALNTTNADVAAHHHKRQLAAAARHYVHRAIRNDADAGNE